MTITTTLKLPEELRAKVQGLAAKAGKTPHAWMLEAIAAEAERSARRAAFIADAVESAREVRESGQTYSADEVHAYLRARAAGKKARRPTKSRR
ncbi:MAG: hypothetical protein QM765_32670 [Myxococcales bacterium]